LSSMVRQLRNPTTMKLTETHKDAFFLLFIKYFLILGTDLTSPHLLSILRELGGAGAGAAGEGGLASHLAAHALSGNWKKFKNCLKTFMK
jgi:hypothetical protein